ncbi:hypothetical protein [Velocimicrobium porci]|uniref:Polymerase/histidinol phosphatase N-terminal domain-containing protein n=1 Tax=Velocimicrobium porci TaxID=2606634 RepID=A0A6L5XY12_9FIRM|nr:hypothetical protein [Velocimicrobium porci]MSS63499.1 hypothetical protein [Velocimicrobium porci]
MRFKSKRFWSMLMCIVMVITMIPVYPKTVQAAVTADVTAITDIANLESGDYIMVNDNNFAVGNYDNGYLLSKEISEVTNDTLVGLGEAYIWHVTKNGSNIKLQDVNEITIKSKNLDNKGKPVNGVEEDKTGVFEFQAETTDNGTGIRISSEANQVVLAQNTQDTTKRFRCFKQGTVNGNAAGYPSTFKFYKITNTNTPAPAASVENGVVKEGQEVYLSPKDNDENTSILYKQVDGYNAEQPAKDTFTQYVSGSAIKVEKNCTIFAYAKKDGFDDSKIVAFKYSLNQELEGGTYFIYHNASKSVMKYLLEKGAAGGVAGVLGSDGKITFGSDTNNGNGAAVYDITKQGDGSYVISCGDKYLTSDSSSLWLADTATDTENAGSYWEIEYTPDFGGGYTIKNKTVTFGGKPLYLEYYKGFKIYSMKQLSADFVLKFADASGIQHDNGYVGTRPVQVDKPIAKGKYFIYSKKAEGVMKYEVTGGKAGAVKAAVGEDNVPVFASDTKNGEGSGYYYIEEVAGQKDVYTIKCGNDYLSADKDKNLYLTDTPVETSSNGSYWEVKYRQEFDAYTIKSTTVSSLYLEYYPSNGFCLYGLNGDLTDIYTFNFLSAENIKDDDNDGYLGKKPETPVAPVGGKSYVIYNESGSAVFGPQARIDEGDKRSLDQAKAAKQEDGTLKVANGGLIFNVTEKNGLYRFENNGKYLASNSEEELFLIAPGEDKYDEGMTEWKLDAGLGGFVINNNKAKWNSAVICVEYFSGGFAGYSYKATSPEIFQFNFYEQEDTYGIGYVIAPEVIFNTKDDANLGLDYRMKFTLDDLGEIQTVKATVTFEDGTNKNYDVTREDYNGEFTIPKKDLNGHTSFTAKVDVTSKQTETVTVPYSGTKKVMIQDEPVVVAVSPSANAETGENKRPNIEITYANIGENAKAQLNLNGEEVALKQNVADNKYVYTPTTDLYDGKCTATVTITRADKKSVVKTWSFYIGSAGVHPYFGQIHAHTAEYSDGSGTLAQAYEYAMNKAKDTDYLIVTDHSNYFDTTATSVKDSIYDDASSSLTKSEKNPSLNKWQEAKATAKQYDEMDKDFVAGYGYEMTWSGGPGHINVFNSKGIVSRNNAELNDKKNNAGMFAFYDLVVDANKKGATATGNGTISAQFNHPGPTFGTFDDFAGYTPERDEIMNLIEVGNGDGAVGSTAYFPSYQYYDMCLSMGWHVAPTNGQDNHKGGWGDINTMRTVVLADSFTEDGIYEAMNARHVYSTEDQNLSVIYHLGDTLQGGIIDDYNNDKVSISVTVSDKDVEKVGTVYVIGENGKELYKSDYIDGNTADLSFDLDNTSAYYYVKVVQGDGDIAVTAPVWVSEVNKEKVTADVTVDGEGYPVEKQNATLNITLANKEEEAISVNSYKVTVDGNEVANKEVAQKVEAGETWKDTMTWKPENYGEHEVIVTYIVTVGGEQKTITKKKGIYVAGEDYNKVVSVKTAKAGKENEEFTIEGYVTANASGYDKNTAFFDCIYVQDGTAGINVFPVSGNYQVGQKVKLHGGITYYNGEMELNVSPDTYGGYVEITDKTISKVEPKNVSCAEAMSDENIGLLMKVTGTVTRVHEVSGTIDRIYVTDNNGKTACVYINGYIWNSISKDSNFGKAGKAVKVGDKITAVGLGSVDVDELGEVEYLHRLRVRDRAEIEFINSSGSDSFPNLDEKEEEKKPEDSKPTEQPEDTKSEIPKKLKDVKTTISTKAVTNVTEKDGFYYNKDGKKVTNAIVTTKEGTRYILDKSGEKIVASMITAKNGTKYITDNAGAVVTGTIVVANSKRYYTTKSTGKVVTDQIITVKNNKYVATKSGAFVQGKIVTKDKAKYYCTKGTGKVVVNKVFKFNKKTYVATKSGKLACSKWITMGEKQYYCDKNGVVTKTRDKAKSKTK